MDSLDARVLWFMAPSPVPAMLTGRGLYHSIAFNITISIQFFKSYYYYYQSNKSGIRKTTAGTTNGIHKFIVDFFVEKLIKIHN